MGRFRRRSDHRRLSESGELSVSFTLQVREKDAQNAQWQDADVYFKANLADTTWEKLFAGYDFTAQLSGILGDSEVWGVQQTFNGLPQYIKKQNEEDVTALSYRVIETEIRYGGTVIAIQIDQGDGQYTYQFEGDGSGLFAPAYWANGKDKEETEFNFDMTRQLYNELKTTSLTVAKIWEDDHQNAYQTRRRQSAAITAGKPVLLFSVH